MLGYTKQDLLEHLETFDLDWKENHIDHIFPISSAKTERDTLALNHYTNLRPMWASDNIKKSNKMPIEQLDTLNNEYNQSSTLIEKRVSLTNSINNMAENLAEQTPNNQDKQSVKISFVSDMIKALIKAIANILISPKIIIIFLINFKIVYGLDAEYLDAKDFIKKNRNLFKSVFKDITQIIVKILMDYALKEITRLAGDAALVKLFEKTQNRKQQLLSLVGVSQEALRKIKGLL
jgi:hypothetical protein